MLVGFNTKSLWHGKGTEDSEENVLSHNKQVTFGFTVEGRQDKCVVTVNYNV